MFIQFVLNGIISHGITNSAVEIKDYTYSGIMNEI